MIISRILTKWTFTRALYLLAGVAIVIQSVIERNWLMTFPGIYFGAMGLFAFGCASSNGCISADKYQNTTPKNEITYETVKPSDQLLNRK